MFVKYISGVSTRIICVDGSLTNEMCYVLKKIEPMKRKRKLFLVILEYRDPRTIKRGSVG